MSFQRIKIAWVALLLLLAAPVHAQGFLDMAVTPGAQTGLAGTQQFWNVTLFNNTGSVVDITLTGFMSGFPVTPDVNVTTGLLPSGAMHLADGQSVAFSSLITTSIRPAASGAIYDALAEMTYDETDSFGFAFSDLGGLASHRETGGVLLRTRTDQPCTPSRFFGARPQASAKESNKKSPALSGAFDER